MQIPYTAMGQMRTCAMSSNAPTAVVVFPVLCEGNWVSKRFDLVACWVLTVISG